MKLQKLLSLGSTVICIAMALVLWTLGSAGAGVPVSLTGKGSPAFQADLPVFFDHNGPRMDLAIIVYHPELKFLEVPGGGYAAEAVLRVKLARSGRLGLEVEEYYVVQVDEYRETLDPTRFALLELSRSVEDGSWAVTVGVEDLNAGVGMGEASSEAEGVLHVPLRPPEGPFLSDLEYRWSSPGGIELPNPERIYGVNQDTLIVYFELNRAEEGPHPYTVHIEDPFVGYSQGDTILIEGGGERTAASYRVPVGSFLEGAYTLRLAPLEGVGVAREGDFVVTWSMEHLVQTARNAEMEIELLFEGDDRDRILAMPRAAQLSALNAFWESVDPTPGTAANETYAIFQARVDHSRRHFRDQAHSGPLSARGRAYIQYGPPSEVQVEVLPSTPDELEEAIVKVHDQSQMDRPGRTMKDIVPLQPNVEAYQDLQRYAPGSSNVQAAFELWIYDMDGAPLMDNDGPIWPEEVNLRFLFVDTLGTGIYGLEFSNYPFGKH